eukprot:m51a1_g7452 hypothetical protein (170) ;mRNA; f:117015-117903
MDTASDLSLVASTTRVTLVVRTAWMEQNGVSASDIREAGRTAAVHRASRDDEPLGPCAKCSDTRMPPVVISGEMGEEAPRSPEERVFVFYRCLSFCNSSRLHLGGDVVLALTVMRGDEAVVRVLSQPLVLHSKTSYRPQIPRPIKWIDAGSEPRRKRRRPRPKLENASQ